MWGEFRSSDVSSQKLNNISRVVDMSDTTDFRARIAVLGWVSRVSGILDSLCKEICYVIYICIGERESVCV